VESCWVLDAGHLSKKGCLQPGGLGTLPWTDGNQVYSINLRYEAGQLYLSWRSHIAGNGEQGEVTEIIPIVYAPAGSAAAVPTSSVQEITLLVVVLLVVGGVCSSCSSHTVISCAGIAVRSSTPPNPRNRGSARTGVRTSCGSVSTLPG
jgi:hypothetical protein